MSKSSPCTPQRSSRYSRSRDAATYADMLIEQLLAQASSVTDSSPETSPPSNEESSLQSTCAGAPESHTPYNNLNNNNNVKSIPAKLSFSSPQTPIVPPCVLSPAPVIRYQIPPNSETEEVAVDEHNMLVSNDGFESEEPSACYATTDSGVTSSEAVHPITTMANINASRLSASAKLNITTSSTPELPTSGSSDSLDIPFASMFDINCSQLFPEEEGETPRSGNISPEASIDNGASPVLSQSTFGSFPTRYSHSYARELNQIEQNESEFSSPNFSLPPRPSSVPIDNSLVSNNFSYQDELVVELPPRSLPPPPRPERDFNINENYKPLLSDKLATEFSASDDERPPIPPRRPLTDSKVHFAKRCAPPLRHQPTTPRNVPHNSPMNSSWSFYDLSGSQCHPEAVGSQTPSANPYITVRDRKVLAPLDPASVITSASKRRRANDKSALPVLEQDLPCRSARQRLSFTPSSPTSRYSCTSASSPMAPGTKSLMRPRKKTKRQSPAMRRLAQQKENSAPSPLALKPLNDLNNFNRSDSYLLTTSSNSLTQSSDAYAKSSDTSPDIIPFLSREEELLDRDAYYCDFTVDRQQKIDSSRKLAVLKPSNQISHSPELLVRTVEGAESSSVFQKPAATLRAPKPLRRQRPASAIVPLAPLTINPKQRSSSSERSNPVSRSSSTSSRKKTVTHPLASSTMIQDETSAETDYGSVYTWSIDEESSQCDLEKSYLRSTKKPKRNHKVKLVTPRPPTSCGHDTSDSDAPNFRHSAFEIGAMVTLIDETMKIAETASSCTPKSKSKTKQIMSAAPSFMKRLSGSVTSDSSSQLSDPSSNQATTSSAAFNLAKGSMVISSSEPSQMGESNQLSAQAARRLSTSEPVLPGHYYDDSEPEYVARSFDNQNRLDIPGKSSSSSSSPTTAARCRPYRRKADVTLASPEPVDVEVTIATDAKSTAAQDLIDSILTDSPKSVDSSGIFAPYNSYTSPVESVGSHNGYSSTMSSSVASSDYNCAGIRAPPATPSVSQSQQVLNTPTQDTFEFKRPFDPIPFNLQNSSTKNQGVSASAIALNPTLSAASVTSLNSDPLVFAVPPGVVTGPPKIKDKKSLVRKLKKFSSNFYKKTEKITTLANL